MARILFTTVGTTALTARSLGEISHADAALQEDAGDFANGGTEPPRLFDRVLAAHQELWTSGQPIRDYLTHTSAEMTSNYFLLKVRIPTEGGDLFRSPGDRIVLLASDTPEGKFSARLNARLMHEHLFHPPCPCKTDFSQAEPACPSVPIRVIRGLHTQGEFPPIANQIRDVWDEYVQAGDSAWFNITGGFKGAIPAITFVCTQVGPVEVVYAHETMDDTHAIAFRFTESGYKEQPYQF